MISERLNKKQVAHPKKNLNATPYTAAEIAQAAEFLFILNDPASLPAERDVAENWFRHIFLAQNSREFRDKARELYASLRNAREV
jgi:hypothetical protein